MSVRQMLGVTSLLLAMLVLGQLAINRAIVSTQAELTASETQRLESARLAAGLRQTSDDLTRMARTFVVTGDARFAEYFDRILAIRNGEVPRPKRYFDVYWDLLIPDGQAPTADGAPRSLRTLLEEAGITDGEKALLRRVSEESNALALTEAQAMNATRGLIADANGEYTIATQPQPELARRLMHGSGYHAAKARIMAPINEFIQQVDARTTRERDVLEAKRRRLSGINTILVTATLLCAVLAGLGLYRRIGLRLGRLADGMQRLGAGDLEEVAVDVGNDEIGRIGTTFNHMVENLREKRDRLAQQQQELRRRAFYDDLTGLPNRALFRRDFAKVSNAAKRQHHHAALMFLDLDGFKHVNDTLGHSAGDELLREVARRLSSCLRSGDGIATVEDGESAEVARFGGDEFVIFVSHLARRDNAAIVASRLIGSFVSPIRVAGTSVVTTPSIGIATVPDDGEDFETLLRQADSAMYQAKMRGKNQFSFCSPELSDLARGRLAVETRLRAAIEGDLLELHYQPLVRADSGVPCAVEALVRWQDEQLGRVSPDRFVGVAEDCGLITALDHWVLQSACRSWVAWRDDALPCVTMCVNVAARTLGSDGFVASVRAQLEATGMPATALELEITERSLADDEPATLEAIAQLRRFGVQFAIDDFGTGYSSLAYLRRFEVDVLKIDRSFVTDLNIDARSAGIAAAIVSVANVLGFTTVAEGIESQGERDTLVSLGVDVLQGWLFARAMPEGELRDWMREHASNGAEDTALVMPRS